MAVPVRRGGTPKRQRDGEVGQRSRRRATQVPSWSPWSGRTGDVVGPRRRIHGRADRTGLAVRPPASRRVGSRDTVPVTMAAERSGWRAGSMGAPRSRQPDGPPGTAAGSGAPRPPSGSATREASPTGCCDCSTPRTSISGRATPTWAIGPRPARAPVRGLHGDRRSRDRREGRPRSSIAGDLFDSNVQPRRSVERVAAELKRLVEAGSARSSSRAPTTSTIAPRSTAPTTSRRSPARGRRDCVTVLTRTCRRST